MVFTVIISGLIIYGMSFQSRRVDIGFVIKNGNAATHIYL